MHLLVDRSCVPKDFTKYRIMIRNISSLNNPRFNTMRSVISNYMIFSVDEVSVIWVGIVIVGTKPQLIKLYSLFSLIRHIFSSLVFCGFVSARILFFLHGVVLDYS